MTNNLLSLDNPSRNLSRAYLIALGSLVLLITTEQMLIQYSLNAANAYANTINVAGRQRMLSQKITKQIILIFDSNTAEGLASWQESREQLATLRDLFTHSHHRLKHPDSTESLAGNSEQIKLLFANIEPSFQKIVSILDSVLAYSNALPSHHLPLKKVWLEDLLKAEKLFLITMEHIVSLYEEDARSSLDFVKSLEIFLLIIILLNLLLQTLWVFKPSINKINNLYMKIANSEKQLQASNKQLELCVENRTSQLKEALARLEAIVDSAADAIINIDNSGNVLSFNKAAINIFGYKESEVIGHSVNMLMPDSYQLDHANLIDNYLDTGESTIIGIGRRLLGKRKDGDEFPIQLSVSKVEIEDTYIFTGILRDISLQDRLEHERVNALMRAQESSKLKAEFLACMSHEVRTPMNVIVGFLDLLLNEDLSKQQRRYLSLAHSGADTLLAIINDILDFSKIEAGKLELEMIDFDLHGLLDELAHLIAVKARDKSVELIVDLVDIPHIMVQGDPIRIRQTLSNILSNAIKFTEQGEILFKASLHQDDNKQLDFHCHIADTGIGIAPDKISQLFESFTQSDASTTREYGGTGLGLSIVKKLCDLMGGSISVESELSKGSQFDVHLRLDLSDQEATTTVPSLYRGTQILLAMKNDNARSVLRRQFEHWGAIVVDTASGATAAKYATQVIKDCNGFIIVDNQLADMTGLEFGKKLCQNTPLIQSQLLLLTPSLSCEEAKLLSGIGFTGIINKPATTSSLVSSLSTIDKPCIERDKQNSFYTHLDASVKTESKLNILLVEDTEVNQEVALAILDNMGNQVTVANNGKQAIDILKNAPTTTPFQLVLMDCNMPVMDGYEATQHIRCGKAGPANAGIPIIALTATAMVGERERCLDCGMDDYITKPVDTKLLKQKIAEFFPSTTTKSLESVEIEYEWKTDSIQYSAEHSLTHDKLNIKIEDIWNKERFYQRIGGKQEIIHNILNIFLKQTPSQLDTLGKAIENMNWEQARISAHALKGSAANIGAPQAQVAAIAMELTAANGDRSQLADMFLVLKREFATLYTVLDSDIMEANNGPNSKTA